MGRRAIVLLVALILAGLAAWAVWQFLIGVEAEAQKDRDVITVFVAGPGGIDEGAAGSILVSAYDADTRCSNPETLLADAEACPIKQDTDDFEDQPVGVLDSEDKLRQVLVGKVAAGPIAEGSILTSAQWTTVSVEIIPLSDLIPPGKQALTISTGNVQGVNGFVEAGDRINMIITLDIAFDLIPVDFDGITLPDDQTTGDTGDILTPEDQAGVVVTYTRYVLQGIPVLATGREIRPDDEAPSTVEIPGSETEGEPENPANSTVFTLEVTPDQAERIVFAFENGSIWLTLVPPDFVEVETDGVVIDNLFGGDLIEEIFGTQEQEPEN